MIHIKKEYLDLTISSPFTGKDVYVRTMEFGLYEPFHNAGYQWLFIEEEKIVDRPTECVHCGELLENCECEDKTKD